MGSAAVALLLGRRLFLATVGDAVACILAEDEKGCLQTHRHTCLQTPWFASQAGNPISLHISSAFGNRYFKEMCVPPLSAMPQPGVWRISKMHHGLALTCGEVANIVPEGQITEIWRK